MVTIVENEQFIIAVRPTFLWFGNIGLPSEKPPIVNVAAWLSKKYATQNVIMMQNHGVFYLQQAVLDYVPWFDSTKFQC